MLLSGRGTHVCAFPSLAPSAPAWGTSLDERRSRAPLASPAGGSATRLRVSCPCCSNPTHSCQVFSPFYPGRACGSRQDPSRGWRAGGRTDGRRGLVPRWSVAQGCMNNVVVKCGTKTCGHPVNWLQVFRRAEATLLGSERRRPHQTKRYARKMRGTLSQRRTQICG